MPKRENVPMDVELLRLQTVEPSQLDQQQISDAVHRIAFLLGPAGPPDLCYEPRVRSRLKVVCTKLVAMHEGRKLN